uniref:MBL fold metallo-hydrolase n=1 Tax=candidate division CPR3 bacterium TaxID=2268181 RepID=A0A7V3N432_UNCC3
MKIIFLGTNGWYDTKTGNTVCIIIETNDYTIILDAGNGISKLDRFIEFDKPAYLFLSHFHLDHIEGLHTISKFRFQKGLNICGSKGIEATLNRVVAEPFTIPFNKLNFDTRCIELPDEEKKLPFKVKCLPLNHSSVTLGFRFEIDQRIIAYCTDTGYCENTIEIARGADLLITECALKSGQQDLNWPHLNPQMAAQIAQTANTKQLVLTHFDAEIYKTLEERQTAGTEARKIFANTFVAKDNMIFKI